MVNMQATVIPWACHPGEVRASPWCPLSSGAVHFETVPSFCAPEVLYRANGTVVRLGKVRSTPFFGKREKQIVI